MNFLRLISCPQVYLGEYLCTVEKIYIICYCYGKVLYKYQSSFVALVRSSILLMIFCSLVLSITEKIVDISNYTLNFKILREFWFLLDVFWYSAIRWTHIYKIVIWWKHIYDCLLYYYVMFLFIPDNISYSEVCFVCHVVLLSCQ